MDIATQSEILLREVDYQTRPWSGGAVPAVCFENHVLIGFIHVFKSAEDLLNGWEEAQRVALVRHAVALRSASVKAWNIYSVFLTGDVSQTLERRIERIEEDFTLARKIARGGIQTTAELGRALLPLLPIRAQPSLTEEDYGERIRLRLKDVSADAVTAFLGPVSAEEVARILESGS
jgi:hypothetical protein